MMIETIQVCQAPTCQQKGSKTILHRFHEEYAIHFRDAYPQLKIEAWDCSGECEQGPMVRINETFLLKAVEKEQVADILQHPENLTSQMEHVLEKDRETFDRIISGELY